MQLKNIDLRELRLEDREPFLEAVSKTWEMGFTTAHYFEDQCYKNYDKYIQFLTDVKKGINIPAGHVPSTSLFAFYNGMVIGRVSIRHELNDFLFRIGGHIGYVIKPEFRQKGVAKTCLRLSCNYVKKNHPSIKKILLTCDETNLASEKVITYCNGVFASFALQSDERPRKKRFWIDLNTT